MKREEAAIQRDFVKWLELKRIIFHSIPNEGKRSVQAGNNLVRMGLRRGVPDLFVCQARNGYHGLYIELKTIKGKLTKLQAGWLEALTKEGYKACVAYGFDEAQKIVEDYFNEIHRIRAR